MKLSKSGPIHKINVQKAI